MRRFVAATLGPYLVLSALVGVVSESRDPMRFSGPEIAGRIVYVWMVAGVPLLLAAVSVYAIVAVVFWAATGTRRTASVHYVALPMLAGLVASTGLMISERAEWPWLLLSVLLWSVLSMAILVRAGRRPSQDS